MRGDGDTLGLSGVVIKVEECMASHFSKTKGIAL